MNKLKMTAAALTSWLAIGLYSAPAFSAMINATGADFQYGHISQGYSQNSGIGTTNNRHLDKNALDGDTATFRSLGLGGAAVFSFDSAFSGTVTIWETTFGSCSRNGSNQCTHWPEAVDVYAGNTWNKDFSILSDLSSHGWTLLGELGNAQASGANGGSLQANGTFNFLLLIDKGLATSSPKDGFDVAKVSVTAVPVPGAVWLFGSALVGMIGLGRRHAAKNA